MDKKTVCIIGEALPSGICHFAARNHASVILLEQMKNREESFWQQETANAI